MSWVPYVLIPLVGFFGAGAVSLWRTDHRGAAGLLALVAVALLAGAILWLLPAS